MNIKPPKETRYCIQKFTFNPKEGIDNPLMVITEESTPRPRLCVLKKEEGEAYGFHLRVEWVKQGHIIRNVVSGGIAGRCGLEDGDRLLEVNNVYVEDAPHQEVARRIKLSGHHLCLLVLDGDAYEKATAKGHDLRDLVKAYKGEDLKPPRLCHITRDPVLGLGMKFTPVGAEKGCFSVSLVPGGAAEKAGVLKGDRLVWMNGAVASDLTHSALSRMMKKCGKYITILVIDSKSEKKYTQLKMPILPTMAVPHHLPYRSKKLELDLAPEGYGFLLRFEKAPSGRTAHVLRKVDTGSPAERAGIRDGDVLLEVNGESVELLQHDEIVTRVRESGRHISLTTVIPQGHEFYTQLGLSPLIFCEDDAIQMESREPVPASQHCLQTGGSSKTRLCSLQKGSLGYGFNFGCRPQCPGTFISQVAPGSPGKKAGLRMGDIVIEVNGQNVEDQYLEDVIMLVKEGGPCLSLLVKDKEGYDDLKKSEELSSTASEGEETEVSRL
ncbi:NHERF family PDZ scaffold protein 4b isoform X3 [Hippocampus comes]|uniref:NHERF family PDZ scaffold protein 4b isoform X2 n=1 Tax=Hippocampus comes TaxID=109280 RepID=UPI00094EEC58|nr:PREDICTED: Na(+)/H(+) exchange regulatory cofactor NHE-RF3-like isoform X2 [Hippocampus comes]XP_019750877.1 PREDICTED: Na(+)/H(+) exchange regulatory cofactor NHE-RF3-like isoform X3 [Hippocampus comes]